MEQVVILGSTGSIGCNTLTVIRENKDKYTVFALTAKQQVDKLFEQCLEFAPKYVVVLDRLAASHLKDKLQAHNLPIQVLNTAADLAEIVTYPEVDIVMSAIVGSDGLLPTYNALKAGKKVLLANKESLIAGGQLMLDALHANPHSQLIPVDSEHSAIFQCMPKQNNLCTHDGVTKIILTASGGPFRTFTKETLKNVTPEMALKHPNWSMGKKITIDSSTLMNKGLEVIEAYWLFGMPVDKLEVVIHPQSIIHSMVEYVDGSVLAQLGAPDMKTPIACALAYPKRINSCAQRLDFTKLGDLTFAAPDFNLFPCLGLAYEALKLGGGASCILNAANEVAVELFLNHAIKFYDISNTIEYTMNHLSYTNPTSIDEVIELDKNARNFALRYIK